MRTIKFRGKEIETNQWVYGDLLQCPNKYPTIRMWEEAYPIARSIDFVVFPESVGQFTGLHDKNGKEIYDGDIVHCSFGHIGPEFTGTVTYADGEYVILDVDEEYMLPRDYGEKHIEVIGNIHNNPELMKGGEE